MKPAVDYVLSS